MSDEADRRALRRGKSNLIDVTVPNAARVADFLAGGRDNFAVDREVSRLVVASAPGAERIPREVRAFRRRLITYLVAEAGVRQFLEVGTNLGAPGHIHEVVQSFDPACRVLYTESDPMVLARAQAKIGSSHGGTVSCVDGNIDDVDAIIAGVEPTLDLSRPVAVLLSTLAYLPTTIAAARAVASLMAATSSGSYVAVYHLANDLDPTMATATRLWNKSVPVPVTLRSRADVTLLVEGLEMIEPGVVPITHWQGGPEAAAQPVAVHAVVARKR